MATSGSSNDTRNFQCVTVASVDVIKLPLSDILASHIKPVDLYHKIKSCSTLKLRPDQQKICSIPPPGVPDYNKFDVTLLYTLIRNLCSLPCPAQGWGNEPRTKDTQISDDIERLRLFRNNYYAHAESAVISDAVFKDVWKNLKLIFKRIRPKMACSIDYEEQLIHIERTKFTDEYLTTFRVLLEALVTLEKQTDDRDEPTVSIRGENEIILGDTAHFEADVKKADSSCWSIIWHRRRGDDIKCIDTSVEKYSGSTKRTLVIKSVCKEDEGEYQALLSFESKGPDYKSRNTIRLHVIGDVPSVRIFLDSPIWFGSETIIKSVVSSTPTPEKTEWQKSKDGTNFHLIGKTNIYLESTEHFKNPFLVIPKTTFADKLFYRLWVWNRFGKNASNTLYLNVTGSPPNITTSFVTDIKNRSVKLMGEVYFYDYSPGILKTFWTKNGEKIDIEESNGKLSETRTDNPSLTITNVGPDDAGEYKVTAINAVGTTTSEVIVLGIPSVFSERVEDEKNGGWRITVTITSFPAPCQIRWNAKSKDDETFTPIDINAEEYDGTTVTFPHPVLVVRQRDQLEKHCYQIEVTNFIGKIVQTIAGNNKPTVRKKDIVQNTFYKDRGARVRFTKLSNILAKEFPPQKLENLKFMLTNSNIVQNRTSVMEATSALQCIRILQDEELFTQTDVIAMQFLCTQTECLDLHAKCVEYAEQQKALCYFEKPPVNGYKNAQFHVKGDLSSYTKDFIQDVIETVAAILDCKVEDILLNGVRHSKSFLLSLAVKEVYMKKLLALNEQDCLRLVRLNIDYLIIDKETRNLERRKGETCDKNPVVLKNTAAYLGLRTTQSLKERSPSTGVPLRNQVTSSPPGVFAPISAISDSSEPDDKQVDRQHAALYRTSSPHASKGIQEETEHERLPPGQDPGPLTGLSSANTNLFERLDDVNDALKDTAHVKEKLQNRRTMEQKTLSETIEKKSIDNRVHEQERIHRLWEIYEGFDPRTFTLYKGKTFKKSDIPTHGRKLIKEGKIVLKSARGQVTEATMVVLTDLIFFMQEHNGNYTFFSQENKSCAIPLFELEVLEKSDTKESKGIFLISQNKDTPMIYEVVCNTNSERETWIREIKSASKKCLPEYEMQPQESNKEERRQMMKGSNKIRKIIELLHRKDEEMKAVCDNKNQLVTELLDIYSMRHLAKSGSIWSDEGTEHMDAIQAAIQQASNNLTNMLGADSGSNQLMRHVSSVGEHVSSSFTVTSIAKRANTFAGFDTTLELFKGDNRRKRQGSHLMDMEGQQLDKDSELSYDQQSLVCNDSNDSSSCNYDITTGSVMEAYPSKRPVYLACDYIRQLSISLNNIAHLTFKYVTEVESLKAQLAEANERIKQLSAGLIEKRGGSCKFNTLEKLRNIKDKVKWETEVKRGILEEQDRQLEKARADLAAIKDEFKRQKENTSSAVEMLVRKRIERVMPTFYQHSPNKNTHRRSQSGDVCSTIEGDHERLSLDHVQTWRDLCLRDDKTKESEIHVTPSFSSSVCSELVGIKNQQLPVHLLSAKNEQKKSTSPSQLSQYVGSGKEVQQVLPFKLADATGGKSSTQAGPPPKSASHIKKEGDFSGLVQLRKEIIQGIDDRIHWQERKQRLFEIYAGFEPRASTLYKGTKLTILDILFHGGTLVKEGTIGLKNAREHVIEATMVVLTDLIFFMQEQNGKYTFFSQENKFCAIPLFELLVLMKTDTNKSKGIFLISQNMDTPMYEIVCNTNSEREAWTREIKAASEKCLPEYKMQPRESDMVERRQKKKESNKIREIIELLHRKDEEMKAVCDNKNQLVTELLDIYSMRHLAKRPGPNGSDEGAKHMDAIQAAIQQANVTASNLNNMLGAGSGPNQLMRHVSSVGEHVSSSFTVTSRAKRVETFAGFDTTLELFKGDNRRKRQGSHLMDMEGQQLDKDSKLSYDQQSLVHDSSSVNNDSQSTTASVMDTYPSQLPVYLAGDHMRQLSTSLSNIGHLTSKYGTKVESLKAQLAEANEKIKKLSEDMNEKLGGSYKHHALEDLHNIPDKVKTAPLEVQTQQIKTSLERPRLGLERKITQPFLVVKKNELKQEALHKQRKFHHEKKFANRNSTKEKNISAKDKVVLKNKGSLEGTSATDPKPTSYDYAN